MHTKGPWAVKPCFTGEECWCRRNCENDTPDDDGDYDIVTSGSLMEHNAALIAAAPELAEALQAVINGTFDTQTADKSMNVHVLGHSAYEKAKAALKKAGMTPDGE